MMLQNATAVKRHWGQSLLLLLVVVFLAVALNRPGDTLAFDNEPVYDFNDGWELLDVAGQPEHKSLTLPVNLKTQGLVRIAKKVSNLPIYPAVLAFRTSQQRMRLYCEEELIYSFGYDNPNIFGKAPGSGFHLIRLPKDVLGKTLVLELESAYSAYQGKIGNMSLGTKASLLFMLLRDYTIALLLTLVIFGTGIICTLAYFLVLRKNASVGKEMLYLGLFSIFVAVWLFGESRMTQFFGIPLAFNTQITVIAMLATPIPMTYYVACGRDAAKQKLLKITANFLSLLLAVSLMLQAFGVIDFMQQLPYIHFCFFLACVAMLYVVISDAIKYRTGEHCRMVLCLGILAVFFTFELIVLYKGSMMIGGMMRIGVLLVICLQVQLVLKKAANIMRMSRLASVDALTSCFNRTAYHQMIEELEGQKEVGVVIADINDLKRINDTYGHAVGDDAIIRCGKHFTEVFSAYGQCFRIGGDEFAMLGKGFCIEQLCRLGASFHERNNAVSGETEYPFSVSYGCTVYDPKQDQTLSDTIRRADKVMYHNKRQFKGQEFVCPVEPPK